MVKQAVEIKDDESALLAVCGTESMCERVKLLWEDIMENKKMDVSDQGLNDEAVGRLLKGLHMCVPLAQPDAPDLTLSSKGSLAQTVIASALAPAKSVLLSKTRVRKDLACVAFRASSRSSLGLRPSGS